MDRAESLRRLAGATNGHLGTVRPDGRPHVVVATFALVGEDIVTAIDRKPKTTQRLQRLVNIEANPAVTFLVDHYEDDWTRLWWVRVDGTASIHADGPVRDTAVNALVGKYERYNQTPPDGPVIVIRTDRLVAWSHTR